MSRAVSKQGAGRRSAVAVPEHDPCRDDPKWRSRVRRRLLDWFQQHARDLPWRRDPTPYRVWVSEIMLQQTQVATVVDYYLRFLKTFPTVEALAAADPQVVLSHWEGLGYYRRARSMHAAAKHIVAQHGGHFPTRFEEVMALPGIGRYTAGAILSIATDQRLPILEGNTQRVFSRLIALRGPTTDRGATHLLWQFAEDMLPKQQSGAFNQAAMELGALVCRPIDPDCGGCPVAADCRARRFGLQDQIPGKVSRVSYEDRTEYALVVTAPRVRPRSRPGSARYLVRMLPEGGRWAGLWDFPRTSDQTYASVGEAARGLSTEMGVHLTPGKRMATIRHAVTRFRIRLHVHTAELVDGQSLPPRPWRFATLRELEQLPMSVTGRQIVQLLSEPTA